MQIVLSEKYSAINYNINKNNTVAAAAHSDVTARYETKQKEPITRTCAGALGAMALQSTKCPVTKYRLQKVDVCCRCGR